MNIGQLDSKIVIESETLVNNTYGEPVATWAIFHTAFAQEYNVSVKEQEEASRITATNMVKLKIRFFAGIHEDMRILYNSNYYDIIGIQKLGRDGLWIKASRKFG